MIQDLQDCQNKDTDVLVWIVSANLCVFSAVSAVGMAI